MRIQDAFVTSKAARIRPRARWRALVSTVVGAALVLSGAVAAAVPASAATNSAPSAPSGLRTELLTDAVVIDTRQPSLSWVVNDPDPDEVQTAYRVAISSTRAKAAAGDYVYDTGWQESAQSTSVAVPELGDTLAANSLYYWQVQTRDRAGAASPLSEPEPFNTPVAWEDNRGAWLQYSEQEIPEEADKYLKVPNGQSSPGSLLSLADGSGSGHDGPAVPGTLAPARASQWTNYSVEGDLYTATALGVVFRRSGTSDYMWQFRSEAIASNKNQVCAHIGTSYVSAGCSPATIPANTWVGFKIVALNNVITTYVDDTLVDTRRLAGSTAGTIGFRTGGSESGRVDNLVVRNLSTGSYLYAEDFSTATGSASYSGTVSVTDGYLNVPTGRGAGDVLTLGDNASRTGLAAYPDRLAPAAASEWTNYAIDADIYVTSAALGIVFRDDGTSNYMWQFRPSNNTLNYHAGRDYAGASPANPASPSLPAGTLTLNTWAHVRIEASGSTITTYIDGVLVGSVTDTNAAAGTIGLRTGGSETANVDNLVVQNLDTGRYLYAENADTLAVGASPDFPNVSVEVAGVSSTVFPSFVFLRHAFDLEQTGDIERAIVTATGYNTQSSLVSMADLFVNGEALGTYPARNHPNAPKGSVQFYNSYDVTVLLREGENVLASLAYNRDAARAVLLQLTVWRTDGSREVIANSGRDAASWHGLDGTPVFGDTLLTRNGGYYSQHQENLVAGNYPFGFEQPGYQENDDWRPLRTTAAINGNRVLAPYGAENTERHLMPAASVDDRGSGTYVVTLDKAIVGSLQLAIDSPAEHSITVKYAESLNSDGSIRMGGVGSGSYPLYQETWSLKPGEQTLRTFLMKSFRYVQIEDSPVPITADMVQGWAMRTAFDEDASSFTSSEALLDRLYDYSRYSIQATNQDLWVDSQARERGAYEGDIIINNDVATAVSADYALGRHSAEWLIDNPTWPADYRLFSVELAWRDYLYTGNADSLVEYYDKIKAKLNPSTSASGAGTFVPEAGMIRTLGDTGSGNRVLVDWPVGEQDGYQFPNPGFSTPYNAVYVGAAQAMANIAEVVGREADRAAWQERADTVRANMIARLYDPTVGAFADHQKDDGTVSTHFAQHSTAYALAYGVFDSPEMAERLTAFVAGQGGFRGSIYASYFVLRGLFEGADGPTALRFLLNPDSADRRTYAHVLDVLKATISPEAWDPSLKANMTMSHPWGASPGGALAHGMFGIVPTKAGFEEFQVRFQPGPVATAAITVPTLRGPVGASSDTTGARFSGNVTVPANTTAVVSLPEPNPAFVNVEVDGQVLAATRDGDFLTVRVGSGSHAVAVSAEGAQYYDVALSGAATVVVSGTAATTVVVTDESGAAVDPSEVSVIYESANTAVATVSDSGIVTAVAEGDTTITVTVSNGNRIGVATLSLRVTPAPRIESLEIRADLTTVGDEDTPRLVGIAEDGSEVEFTDAEFESSDPSVAEVRADGAVKLLSDGEFTLKARTSEHFADLVADFDFAAFEITPIWSADFDDGTNPFTTGPANPSVVDGRLFVDKSKNAMLPIGADWSDYVVSFTGQAVAGTSANPLGEGISLLLRTRTNTPPGQNYYWQLFPSQTMKRGAGIAEVAPVTITGVKAAGEENRIAIAAEGDRFMTYVNGNLVDVWTNAAYRGGTLGVRTGSSDARYYLDDLVVGTRMLTHTREFTAAAVAPVNIAAPSITGEATPGGLLIADPGRWDTEGLEFGYRWLADGEPIPGATGQSLTVTAAMSGEAVTVQVTASVAGRPDGVAVSEAVTVAALPTWQAKTAYTVGDLVVHEGRVFEALWWTQAQVPGASSWSAWSEVGVTLGCETGPTRQWAASTQYDAGAAAAWDGKVWTAKWWTRNQQPGGKNGPWQATGTCQAAA
ncbi:family 78 glycoside hydrolase catalytic domain [Tessaracoccus sp. MC1756]|uniref:family 78 glycoside hydrolase catalytic domain n=1 Tax=Tessaracoccus sp. MC1756 TaxID=2760311 RepID=UPI0015FF04FB|nr:family 78 glycoside hydrolase catalytic domain [Tessaracoccus sp. MC1756]MBB1510503.1 family 78 glycoside hydrolase catalytic domain [Tessaracoccus sp. MC1756]